MNDDGRTDQTDSRGGNISSLMLDTQKIAPLIVVESKNVKNNNNKKLSIVRRDGDPDSLSHVRPCCLPSGACPGRRDTRDTRVALFGCCSRGWPVITIRAEGCPGVRPKKDDSTSVGFEPTPPKGSDF